MTDTVDTSTNHQEGKGKGEERTILLIGSTGSGKSALGNCLLNGPSKKLSDRQVFAVGRGHMPQTQRVQKERGRFTRGDGNPTIPLQVIDTPGLNESDVEDLTHMIDVIQALQETEEITACVLCVNFNSQIDAQYKATVGYYRRLLPRLFEVNVVVVFTNYSVNPYDVRKRKQEGIKTDEVMRNSVAAIVNAGEMTYEPVYFCIDSLPLEEDAKDWECTIKSREAILKYIGRLRGTRTQHCIVAKTPALKEHDNKRVAELKGLIHGYNEKMQQRNEKAAGILDKIETNKKKAMHLKADQGDVQAKLVCMDMDTEQLVPAKQWTLPHNWKDLKSQSVPFNLCSEWSVEDVDKWDNGDLKWEITRKGKSVSGRVTGKLMCGVFANVTLLTTKKSKNDEEIKELREKKQKISKDLQDITQALEKLCDESKEHKEMIEDFMKFSDEYEPEIEECLRYTMDMETANKKVSKMQRDKMQ